MCASAGEQDQTSTAYSKENGISTNGSGASMTAHSKEKGKALNTRRSADERAETKVPGNLYFGFCDEVIRAMRRLGGEHAVTGEEGNGKGLCKIEWDDQGKPMAPVKVGVHTRSLETFVVFAICI